MKSPILVLLLTLQSVIVYSQLKSPKDFNEYLFLAENIDSLKMIGRNTYTPKMKEPLHLLIATELKKELWYQRLDLKQTNQLIYLAKAQRSSVDLAMAYFIMGWYYSSEKEDSISYNYMTKAEKIFTQNKDTTGILFCYRALKLITYEQYPNLSKVYFEKLLSLSLKSTRPSDKYFYYMAINSADPFLEKQPTETQIEESFHRTIKLIEQNPYYEPFRINIYRTTSDGYVNLNRPEKVLEKILQLFNHPKIRVTYVDYQNLGRAYIRVKKYEDAIKYLEKARQDILKLAPTNYRRQRNIYKLLKTAYYGIGNLKESIKADDEFDKVNDKVYEIDRSVALVHLKEKYSFTEKEAELKRIFLEKQVIQSQNELLEAQYEAKKREANLKTLALENQSVENKAKVLGLQMEMLRKENDIHVASTQKRLLIGGLLTTFIFIGFILFFSIRLRNNNVQLKTLQVGRDKFYTIIAHDLRSTVNSLSDLGSVLNYAIKKGDNQQTEKIIQQVEYMGQHAQLLLTNLFEWGKNQYFTNETSEPPISLEIISALKDLLRYYLPLANASGIELQTVFPSKLHLLTPPKGFILAVRNLLDNAFKHTKVGDKITLGIQTSTIDSKIELYISDTGTGIDTEQLTYIQHVFEGKIKPEVGVKGIGLGVLLVNNFVRNSKATIQVTSEVEVGTCFSIWFSA